MLSPPIPKNKQGDRKRMGLILSLSYTIDQNKDKRVIKQIWVDKYSYCKF